MPASSRMVAMFLITWALGMLAVLKVKGRGRRVIGQGLTVCSAMPPSTMVPFIEGTVPAV